MAHVKPSSRPGIIPIVVTLGLSAGVLIALWISGSRDLTGTESVLLAILLSSASMLVSWLATHLYSQISLRETIKQATESNTENIRNLGVRAAEKVLNLSNELQRLVDSLAAALEDAEEMEGIKQPTMLLRERIHSAIHNLETLKSMNDTFLSDWRGVIGEEIERQHILENQIEFLTNELNTQFRERDLLLANLVSPEDLVAIQMRIDGTEERLTKKISELPFKVRHKSAKPKLEEVNVPCAYCSTQIEIRLRMRKGAKKLIRCSECENYSLVMVIEDGEMDVVPIAIYKYKGKCPLCSSSITENVPDHPGATVSTYCKSCEVKLLLSKSSEGANLRIPKGTRQMSEKLIEIVLNKLPHRPWPTHIHKSIAKELGVSNSTVSRIIGYLVEEGRLPHEIEKDASEKSPDLSENK